MKISNDKAACWIREPYLKPIDGGYLFETCNPWLFGPGRRFIVHEDNKQALMDVLKPGVGTFLFTNGIIAYICIVGALWWTFALRSHPDTLNMLGMVITIIVPLYVVSLFAIRRFLLRAQPIISSAMPTRKRSTLIARYEGVGSMMSSRLLWLGLVVSGAGVITNLTPVLKAISEVRMHPQDILSYSPTTQLLVSMSFAAFCACDLPPESSSTLI